MDEAVGDVDRRAFEAAAPLRLAPHPFRTDLVDEHRGLQKCPGPASVGLALARKENYRVQILVVGIFA
jgi:hypothetical protein